MTNIHVSWKSAGKVNFLKSKVIKRRTWKTLNVISTLAIVLNTGMVGVLITPSAARADVGSVVLNSITRVSGNTYKASGTWNPQGNQCFTPGSGFHYKVYVYDDANGNNAYDVGEKLTEVVPAACNGDFTDPVSSSNRDKGGNWPASVQSAAQFTLNEGLHQICAVLIHVNNQGNDIAEANYCYGQSNEKAWLSGYKWKDLNGDQVWSGAEIGLSNWQINRTGPASMNTAADGYYKFEVNPGTYTLSETLKNNWVQTYPSTPGTHSVTVDWGDVVIGKNFGNKPGQCGLVVEKLVDKTTAGPGDILTYTINYENKGDGFCTGGGVKIYDQLNGGILLDKTIPSWLTNTVVNDQDYNSGDPAPEVYPATFNGTSSKLLGNLHEIGPGEKGSITMKVKVNTPTALCQTWDVWNSGWTDGNEVESDVQFSSPKTSATNECTGDLKVNKEVDANGDGTFEGSNTEANALGFDWGLDAGAVNRDMGTMATGLTVGSHDVTENSVTDYHFVGWYTNNVVAANFSCANPEGTTLPISVNVAASATTEITLCNARDTGRITFDKVVVGGDAKDSDFTFTVDGHDYKDGDAASFPTGSYALTEGAVTGYTLTDASGACSLGQNGVTLTVTGQGGTCTINNTRDLGRLLVKKNVLNPDGSEVTDAHEFTVTLDGVNPKTIAEGTSAQYPGLATGTYTVAENADVNYTLDGYDIDTDPGTPGAQITIIKGETTVLTVTNKQKKATITISKDVRDFQGNDVNEAGNFSVTSNAGDFTIAEFDPEVLSVNPGTYTFEELVNGNYTIHSTNPKEITVGSNDEKSYTFENWQKPSSITVCKYVDVNGDHSVKYDPLYTAEGGWTMWLDDELDQQTVDGCTTFSNLKPGTYDISEGKKDGWEKTTPDTNFVSVTVGMNDNSQTVNFGNFQLGKIWGYKYDTLQNPLADWQICLNGDQECTTTNVDGKYEFTGLSAGTYTVAETLQGGWWAVSPLVAGYIVDITSGSVEQRDFVNFQGVNISGSKFNDLNGNGEWDSGEPGLADWTIQLLKNDDGFGVIDTTTTDVNGNYSFGPIGPGDYRVREVEQGDWSQTTTNPDDFTTVSGQNVGDLNFGNYQYGRISGYKFNDLNGNGQWNEGEPALDGWSICLNGLENCVTTGDEEEEWPTGYYEFTGLTANTYEVYEQNKEGWTQTLPGDEYEVVVTSGTDSTHNDFGNYQYGRISGYKYDNDEEPLDGWQICLTKQQPELNSISRVSIQEPNCKITGAGEWPTGYYEFKGLTAGTYMVSETLQYGWTQESPNDPNFHTVVVTSGTDSNNNDFWNRKNVFGVSIDKAAATAVNAGENLTYTLNWSVTGNTPVEVKLFDLLPANTTFVSASNSGFLDGSTVRWNLGTFEPAASGSVTLTVNVNSPLDNGTVISNTGNICGLGAIPDGEPFLSDSQDLRRQKCDDDTTTTTVQSHPELGLQKSANPTTVGGNQDVTYTVTWSVAGNSKATNVVVTDPIPTNTTYVSMGCGTTTGTCTTSTTGTPVTSVTYNLGNRNPGEGGTLTLVVKTAISVPNGSVIPNQAKIAAEGIDPVFAQADVKAATAPQLQITKTANATIVNPGDPITYTVKVKNIGTDTAINAVMTDTLPTGFSFVSTSPTAASIVGQTGTWNLGTMTVGQEVTITYTVNVAPGTTAGTYDNIAKAKADNAPEVSTKVPVQTRVPQVLGETTNPVLQLRKSVSKATVAPGDTVTYTVEIKNTGTGSAINVILTDLLPVGFTFKGTDLTTKDWKLGDIAVGETKTVKYQVTVGKSVPNGSYENLAIVQADNHGKVTTSVPVNVKRGRVLAETVNTGAGLIDLGIAGIGLGLIVLGFVLTRKRGEALA